MAVTASIHTLQDYLDQAAPVLLEIPAAKERELTKITRYKQSLYQDWKDGEITQQEYRDMKADYERQTSDISAVLTRLNAERAELANGVDNEHPALVAFMKYQNIEALNREILVEKRGISYEQSRKYGLLFWYNKSIEIEARIFCDTA